MADCALRGHPRSSHKPRCTAEDLAEFTWGVQVLSCDCPTWEPPEDEENN